MTRRDPADVASAMNDGAWAFGRRYRRIRDRARKPIALTVLLALLVGLMAPAALAEDPVGDSAPTTS